MSRRSKFYKRLKTIPNDIKFDELEKFLKGIGFEISSNGGSHMMISFSGSRLFPIPKHGDVKECYIQKVVEIIEDLDIEIR